MPCLSTSMRVQVLEADGWLQAKQPGALALEARLAALLQSSPCLTPQVLPHCLGSVAVTSLQQQALLCTGWAELWRLHSADSHLYSPAPQRPHTDA